MKYKYVILGGTFDFLHNGHISLLKKAFSISEKVAIGVNSDKFCLDHGKRPYQNHKERLAAITSYLEGEDLLERTIFHTHEEIGCPAYIDSKLQAIIASILTQEGAKEVNFKREQNHLSKLDIVFVPILLSSDSGVISSTRIRNGEIDRRGNAYLKLFEKDLVLPESLRQELRKPFGELIKGSKFKLPSESFIISIGDAVTVKLLDNNINVNIAIFDFKTKRQPILKEIEQKLPLQDVTVENKAGIIEKEAVDALHVSIKKTLGNKSSIAIRVEGEEDLLTFPGILLAPLGAKVFYGMPDKGAVCVKVTEQKKQEAQKILLKFN